MSPTVITVLIVIGVIVLIVGAVALGMFLVINYMCSPNGFVKDLTNPDHEAIAKSMAKRNKWKL